LGSNDANPNGRPPVKHRSPPFQIKMNYRVLLALVVVAIVIYVVLFQNKGRLTMACHDGAVAMPVKEIPLVCALSMI
jgi:hypothetical protein